MDVPLKGNLEQFSLARVFMAIRKEGAGGVLTVKTAHFLKKVYFQDGDPIFAASSLEDERLGEMLVKSGMISLKEYEDSVETLKQTGKRQGAILVEQGYITPKDLFWGVKYQVREIIESLFLLEDGPYEFDPGPLPTNEVITLKIRAEQVIYDGLQRIHSWTRLKRELPPADTVIEVSPAYRRLAKDGEGVVVLSDDDEGVLSRINGKKTIGDLLAEIPANSFELMKTLYIFWSLGIIAEKGAQSVQPAARRVVRAAEVQSDPERVSLRKERFSSAVEQFKKGDFKRAAELLRDITEEDPHDARAWSYYSLALSKEPGRVKEAEEALLKAIHIDPSNSDHLANLGLIYLKAGNKARAKLQFEKALSLDPDNKRAKTGMNQTGDR